MVGQAGTTDAKPTARGTNVAGVVTIAIVAACLPKLFWAPDSALAESEPVAVRMFSSSAENKNTFTPQLPPKEKAVLLNEQAVELVLKGDKKAGIAKIKEALELDPGNNTVLYNLAGLYLSDGEPGKAKEVMRKVLDAEPNDLSFLNRYAEACIGSNDVPQATAVYEKIAAEDQRFSDVLLKLGTVYGMQKEWQKAEDVLKKAKSVYGSDVRVLSNLGSVQVIQEKYKDAIVTLTEAQQITPSAENAVVLGIASESIGKLPEAIAHYQQAISLGEKSKDLEAHVAKLQAVHAKASTAAQE